MVVPIKPYDRCKRKCIGQLPLFSDYSYKIVCQMMLWNAGDRVSCLKEIKQIPLNVITVQTVIKESICVERDNLIVANLISGLRIGGGRYIRQRYR